MKQCNNVAMILSAISLQNFRNYELETFHFDPQTTIVIGPNTAGKSNLIEAIYLTSTGKSFRSEKDEELLRFKKDFARVKSILIDQKSKDKTETEVLFSFREGIESFLTKKYFINGVTKRRADFAGHLLSVLFVPADLEIIIAGPSVRRNFLDDVLEQTDRDYRLAVISYTKALRQRNALLGLAKETGKRNSEQFSFWDEILIRTGQEIEKKREEFIEFVNSAEKTCIPFAIEYGRSSISIARLLQYKDAEVGAGVTLVGPHRDDFVVNLLIGESRRNMKSFGSRGQQRLSVLELKMLQLNYIEQQTKKRPALLLDDIFSELDDEHIELVLSLIGKQQTILTTTHEEFVKGKIGKKARTIRL